MGAHTSHLYLHIYAHFYLKCTRVYIQSLIVYWESNSRFCCFWHYSLPFELQNLEILLYCPLHVINIITTLTFNLLYVFFCIVYRVLKRLWQFNSIFVYIGRSFPTHRTLMGDRPEAIEGQAKLFRVLTAFARYNPQIGYVQGNELPVLPQMRSLALLKSY